LRPHYDYYRLYRSSAVYLIKLHSKVNHLTPTTSILDDEQIAFVVIEAMNVWASFVRAYYLSWFMHPRTITGQRIACSHHFGLFQDALIFAIRRLRSRGYSGVRPSRRDEPTWHDPTTLLTLAVEIGVSNLSQVQAAFSLGATYPANLPTVRNFYAHRNDETFRKVRDRAILLGLGRNLRPCEFVCTAQPSRPQNLISDWLDEIRLTIELLCT
jgi:hypothetical protein